MLDPGANFIDPAAPASQPISSAAPARTKTARASTRHDAVTTRAMRRATSAAYVWLAVGGGVLIVIGSAIVLWGTSYGPGLPIGVVGLLALVVGIVGHSSFRRG